MSHRTHAVPLVAAVLAAVVLSSHAVLAADAKAPRSNAPSPNIRVGLPIIGIITRTDHRVAGREDVQEGMGQYVGASLSYVHPLLPFLSLVGLARWTSEGTEWSDETNEARSRVDLALAPEFGWSPRSKPPVRVTLRASVPVGPTWAWINPSHQTGPVRRGYATGFGLNLGFVAGLDAVWTHSGFYVEFAALRHLTTFDQTATLVEDPSVTSREKVHYDQGSAGIGLGYIYRF